MTGGDWQVGIVGAGQLARMTLQAAVSLDVRVRVLAADPGDPACQVWPDCLIGAASSAEDLARLAASCRVLTFDHELVNAGALNSIAAAGHLVRPSPAAVAVAQDKHLQRSAFTDAGLPSPDWAMAQDAAAIGEFAGAHGWPVVAKAVRGGYDGRGVWVVETPADATRLVEATTQAGIELLVERWVAIELELAVLVARRPGGQAQVYPVVETVQRAGICREVLVPARVTAAQAAEAVRIARAVADLLDVSGMLAVELFLSDGQVLVNEIATRPHNSGHFTIEGAATSQFENHLRAVLDWPLGPTDLNAPAAAMVNVLGAGPPPSPAAAEQRVVEALAEHGVHVHLYGKAPRPGRKIGHVTALGDDLDDARARAGRAAVLLAGGGATLPAELLEEAWR